MKLRLPIHKSDYKRLLCPWSYNELENNGVPQVETEPMRVGTKIHSLVSDFRQGLTEPDFAYDECSNDDEANLYRNALINDPDIGRDRKVEWYFAVDFGGNFVECEPTNEQDPKLNLLLAGRMDSMLYVNPWLKVEDLKTGHVFDRFQPEIDAYCLGGMAYLDSLGANYDSASFVYFWLRTGKREQIDVLRPGEDRKQLKANLVDRITRRVEFFSKLEPMPIPGYHCVSCQFLGNRCPIGLISSELVPTNAAVVEQFISTGEMTPDIAPLVGMYLQRLEARADEIRKKFKPWVEEHGAVRIGNTEWAATPVNKGQFNQEAAISMIEKAALPLEAKQRAVKVNASTLKTIAREYPQLVRSIYDWAYVEKESSMLKLRKVKE